MWKLRYKYVNILSQIYIILNCNYPINMSQICDKFCHKFVRILSQIRTNQFVASPPCGAFRDKFMTNLSWICHKFWWICKTVCTNSSYFFPQIFIWNFDCVCWFNVPLGCARMHQSLIFKEFTTFLCQEWPQNWSLKVS